MSIIPEQLQLFSVKPKQSAIVEEYNERILPANTYTQGSQIIFEIPNNGEEYIDLSHSNLSLSFKVVQDDDSVLGSEDKVSIVDNVFHSMWKSIEVYYNRTLVSDNYNYYFIQEYLNVLRLNINDGTTDGYNYNIGLLPDKTGSISTGDPEGSNTGVYERAKYIAESKEAHFTGILYLGPS